MTAELINAEKYSDYNAHNFHWNEMERPIWDLTFGTVINMHIKYPERLKILDVGCGDGKFSRYLASKGILDKNLFSFDVNFGLLENFKKNKNNENIFCASCSKLPIDNKFKFDLVMSNMVFHYLDDQELKETFVGILNLLKNNGQFWFSIPHPSNVYIDNKNNINNYWETTKIVSKTPWGDNIQIFHRTLQKYTEIIDKSGFKIWLNGDSGPIDFRNVPKEKVDSYLSYPRRYMLMLGKSKFGKYPKL